VRCRSEWMVAHSYKAQIDAAAPVDPVIGWETGFWDVAGGSRQPGRRRYLVLTLAGLAMASPVLRSEPATLAEHARAEVAEFCDVFRLGLLLFGLRGAPVYLEHPLKLTLKFQIASFSFLGCVG
jgi:hypothetical protein